MDAYGNEEIRHRRLSVFHSLPITAKALFIMALRDSDLDDLFYARQRSEADYWRCLEAIVERMRERGEGVFSDDTALRAGPIRLRFLLRHPTRIGPVESAL